MTRDPRGATGGDHSTRRTLPMDSAGVEELGIVPWPVLLRRRIAHRVGLDRRWAVLWVVLSGLFTVSVTVTILVVSLQGIADELDSSVTVLNWALTGPMLAFGVVGPAFGKAGDLWGHKRVFTSGLLLAGVFAGASALAWDAPSLIAFRTLSATAGSACGPSAMAYINRMFEPDQRVRPLSYWSFVTAGAPVLGVVAGGALVEAVGWRVIFVVQAPLCLLGALVALWLLPDTERREGVRFDVWGSVTLGLGAVALLGGVNQGPVWGWSSPLTLACFAVSALLLTVFVRIERRTPDPLVVLAWLRNRNITFPVVSQSLSNFAYMGGFILAPQVLARGLAMTEQEIGIRVIARPLAFSLAAPLAAMVTVRVGERVAGVVGSLGVVVSMLLWASIGTDASDLLVVGALAMSGVGLGIASPALISVVAGAVEDADLGVAGAMQQLMSQLGAVTGSVLLTTIAVSGTASDMTPFHTAFFVAALVSGMGAVAASFVRRTRHAATP